MAKVIVERPRYGSRLSTKGKGYNRRTARLAWEDQPKREGMKVRGGAHKSLNEHLTPLRRYLAGQVGRPWNKIFADICRYLDRNSAVQDHVRDHVGDYVATNVLVHDGEFCHGDGHGIGQPLRTLFYVCPRTGRISAALRSCRSGLLATARRWCGKTAPGTSSPGGKCPSACGCGAAASMKYSKPITFGALFHVERW